MITDNQSETKSYCQEPLKEQEMSRREIRELISKAIDPTRCLEAYDWTFTPNKDCGDGGRWSKTFSFIYPILVIETISKHKKIYLRDKLLV